MQTKDAPFVHRVGEPKEINLKQFYQLSNVQRQVHIEKLKEFKFNELSDTDKGVVFFYFQNWLLEDWPGEKVNFFKLEKEIPTVIGETITEQILEVIEQNKPQQENTSASILDEQLPTVDEICQNGMDYVREYLNTYFELDYTDWETNLRFNTSNKFIEVTLNFMIIDELTKVHIHAYKKLLK